jgi:hypothetical protein
LLFERKNVIIFLSEEICAQNMLFTAGANEGERKKKKSILRTSILRKAN